MTVRVLTNLTPVSPEDYLEWFDLSSRPLLEFARKDSDRAHSVRFEWLVDEIKDGQLGCRALKNYTQILRQPIRREWKDDGSRETFTEAAKRAVELILDDAERVLWYGKPRYHFGLSPMSTCGGVLHYLRRRVYESDTVRLRELTPLMLRRWNDFNSDGDWIWEFSLQVIPGHYERGMKPLFLPPFKQES